MVAKKNIDHARELGVEGAAQPINLAFISQYFDPEPFSNGNIARNLQKRGYRVNVYCSVPNYPEGRFYDGYSNKLKRSGDTEGVTINRVRTVPRGKTALRLILNFVTFPIFCSWTVLRKGGRKADIAFVSMPSPIFQAIPAILLKVLYGTPIIFWVQDIWPESATYTLGLKAPYVVKPLEWLCGWIYRRADLLLVQSDGFPKMIERFGIPADRIRILPNTAPVLYRPTTPEEAEAEGALVPEQGTRVMFAGNIGESQGFDTYIAAAELLRDIEDLTWVIVGSGRDMVRVQDLVAQKGLEDRFIFVGRHPEPSMPRFFAHADIMLVGLKDNDIFELTVPYKIQCYLACGKPIIGSLNGEGARVIERSGAGFAAPAEDAKGLADCLRRFIQLSVAEKTMLGENARAYFDQFYAPEKIYSNLDQWVRGLLKDKVSARS